MRLFHQLEQTEKEEVLNYYFNYLLNDLLDEEFELEFDSKSDLEIELKEYLEKAVNNARQFESTVKQVEFLIKDERVVEIISELAEEMAQMTYYHDDDELVIFPSKIKEEMENFVKNKEEEHVFELTVDKTKPVKKKSDLN